LTNGIGIEPQARREIFKRVSDVATVRYRHESFEEVSPFP
jgi:hypothetical protein